MTTCAVLVPSITDVELDCHSFKKYNSDLIVIAAVADTRVQ